MGKKSVQYNVAMSTVDDAFELTLKHTQAHRHGSRGSAAISESTAQHLHWFAGPVGQLHKGGVSTAVKMAFAKSWQIWQRCVPVSYDEPARGRTLCLTHNASSGPASVIHWYDPNHAHVISKPHVWKAPTVLSAIQKPPRAKAATAMNGLASWPDGQQQSSGPLHNTS